MRRFYVFNNADLVRQHVSQVKTLADVRQLQADIIAADCNLTRFEQSQVRGVYCVDCMAASPTQRHVFMTHPLLIDCSPRKQRRTDTTVSPFYEKTDQ